MNKMKIAVAFFKYSDEHAKAIIMLEKCLIFGRVEFYQFTCSRYQLCCTTARVDVNAMVS